MDAAIEIPGTSHNSKGLLYCGLYDMMKFLWESCCLFMDSTFGVSRELEGKVVKVGMNLYYLNEFYMTEKTNVTPRYSQLKVIR